MKEEAEGGRSSDESGLELSPDSGPDQGLNIWTGVSVEISSELRIGSMSKDRENHKGQ